ncbi:MAG: phosphatidate cytidylyltransferase [Deltaproteobacteria bacterium]
MLRLTTGVILGLGWLLLLLKGSVLAFWLVLLAIVAVLLREFCHMTMGDFSNRDRVSVIILGLLPVAAAYQGTPAAINGGTLLAILLLFLHILNIYSQRQDALKLLLRGVFAIVYLGAFSAHAILIRRFAGGASWMLFLTIVIIASDSGAFYGGTYFGRHKLCPSISPGKTVEGLFCGVLAGVAGGTLYVHLLNPVPSIPTILLLSALLSLTGVLGDLIESIIKRSSGVKDSGTLLPGHGGLFDRLDAILLCVPVLSSILSSGLFS